jgi:acetate kinase
MNISGESLLLTVNAGSSSLRFALYSGDATPLLQIRGKLERIGHDRGHSKSQPHDPNGAALLITDASGNSLESGAVDVPDHRSAINLMLQWLEARYDFRSIRAVGHRVVHGMKHSAPQRITPELLQALRQTVPFDPEHLPFEIDLINAIQQRHPSLLQVACFDTAFHRSMPSVAKILPIPRRYQAMGIERYGFHGLSYTYLLEELGRLKDQAAAKGRVILAHLGNGASMAAVRDGHCMDTSMGFTPTAGLVMSTRSGDLDPGVSYFLAQREGLTPQQIQRMLNHESGLLGISETSSDIRDLLAAAANDARAADAIALFCYQAKKWLGSFTAALGGLDTLVFAGGIGENAPWIRARICADLEFLGIHLDATRNQHNAPVISTDDSPVTVRIIRTDEELMIAKLVSRLISHGT